MFYWSLWLNGYILTARSVKAARLVRGAVSLVSVIWIGESAHADRILLPIRSVRIYLAKICAVRIPFAQVKSSTVNTTRAQHSTAKHVVCVGLYIRVHINKGYCNLVVYEVSRSFDIVFKYQSIMCVVVIFWFFRRLTKLETSPISTFPLHS